MHRKKGRFSVTFQKIEFLKTFVAINEKKRRKKPSKITDSVNKTFIALLSLR